MFDKVIKSALAPYTLLWGIIFVSFFTSCFNKEDWCAREMSRINKEHFNFTVTKVYQKRLTQFIGIDSLGEEQEFYYNNNTIMDLMVKPGTVLVKDSGSSLIRIKKNGVEYLFDYDCMTGGKIIEPDRPKYLRKSNMLKNLKNVKTR